VDCVLADYVWLCYVQLKKDLSTTTIGVAAAVDAYILLTLSPQVVNPHFISCRVSSLGFDFSSAGLREQC
jgi:hypothetical protein